MAVVALRSLKNSLRVGTGSYTPSDLFAIYAEDLNSVKATIGGGYLNPITLLTERYSIDTLSLFIQGTERMDGLGNCLLRETKPEADVVYNLGLATHRWATVYAGNFVGNGAGLTGVTVPADLVDYQLLSEKGAVDGYAELDGSSLVPVAQVPFPIRVAVLYSALTDAATIAVNAALGNVFRVTLGGNRTLGNPTNSLNGQRIIVEVIQDGTGSRTLAYDTNYAFSTDLPEPVLTTTAGAHDFLGFVYNSTSGKWYCLAVNRGF